MNINTIVYVALANSSCVWECNDCGLPNISSSLFDSIVDISCVNRFSPLGSDSTNSSVFGTPKDTSSPTTFSTGSRTRHDGKRTLSVLTVNFQSVMAKNQHIAQMVSRTDPDIIIGTETWLSSVHSCTEILIASSYQIERRDKVSDPHGGVLIAYKKDLAVTRQNDMETDCEIL